MVRAADVPVITRSLLTAAERMHCRVVAHAVLSEHVHVLWRVATDASLSKSFGRRSRSQRDA
jgi:REP element-mobilizing transposase RayT